MKFVFELLDYEIKRYEKSINVLSILFKATNDIGIQQSLLRDEEYRSQFVMAKDILLNSEPNLERSVATEGDSSNEAGNQNS